MNSTEQLTKIATNSSTQAINNQLEDSASSESLKSKKKLNGVKEVRPQMVEVVDQAVHSVGLLKQFMLDQAFAMGMHLTQYKRILGKGKYKIEYDTIVRRVGLTKPLANKYIKLVEFFGDFSTELLKFVNLQTLFELCKPKYASVIERMRNRTDLDDALVRQWIKELKPAPKPKANVDIRWKQKNGETAFNSTQLLVTRNQPTHEGSPIFSNFIPDESEGWQRMPSGGGRVYKMAYDEQMCVDLEQMAKQENLLPIQVNKKAIAEYKERHHQSAEDYWNIRLDSSAIGEAITWEDVERAVNKDCKRFQRAIKDWADEKKAGLTTMLTAYLVDNPEKLANLVWLPTSLIIKALLRREGVDFDSSDNYAHKGAYAVS